MDWVREENRAPRCSAQPAPVRTAPQRGGGEASPSLSVRARPSPEPLTRIISSR